MRESLGKRRMLGVAIEREVIGEGAVKEATGSRDSIIKGL